MKSYEWTQTFRALYEKALQAYRDGNTDWKNYFTSGELDFLASIGCRPMDLYDYAEDWPDLDWDTALLITAARRDFFLHILRGVPSKKVLSMDDFPAKSDEVDGIPWLPRIILKAKCKLRGELPNDLMYDCGGDRRFLREHDIHPADFLRIVWAAGEDDHKVVEFVKCRRE